MTIDVGAGGVCFSIADWPAQVGERIEFELAIPPGEGYSARAGRVHGSATVLRRQRLSNGAGERWAVAAAFDRPLNLRF